MKRQFNSNMKGYIYPFVMVIYMLYLSLIAIYTSRFNLQLKTLDNIESYYDKQIKLQLQKEDIFE
ncbi:hypothetical protein BZ166_10685 [Staphylococcus cohnii]|nr:hypothetical protein BZ166_10685 [Staphylococcus cohnii]OAO22625.1 hypothetical protein AXY36_01520 [Staphylococcus cohnii]PTF38485.1 hypothetical protein BUY29_11970 [Staphylococcus cohnii]RIM45330.1 hypothetical protein BUY22_08825 [Staphylococcus cohnii]